MQLIQKIKIKDKIIHNFNKSAVNYDKIATVQLECAKYLVNQLIKNFNPQRINNILDLGAGTGFVSRLLVDKYPKSYYTLNDLSINMLNLAKQSLNINDKLINLIIGDLEKINFSYHDLIVSNLALQWVVDLEKTLLKFYQKTKFFAFSCLLNGTFTSWGDYFKDLEIKLPINFYPNLEELTKLLESLPAKQRFFKVKEYPLLFANPLMFMRYLKNLGAGVNYQPIGFSILKKLMQDKKPLTVTYKVFFGIIEK